MGQKSQKSGGSRAPKSNTIESLETRVLLAAAASTAADLLVPPDGQELASHYVGASLQVQAASLAVNDRVRANANVIIRSAPPTLTDTLVRESSGGLGTIVGGPTAGTLNGTTYNWYNVSWDDNKSGWSADVGLDLVAVAVTPTISSVSPASPQATDGRQNLTITGTNFDASAYVNLYDPAGTQFTLSGTRVVGRSGSTQITVDPNFTSTGAGTWKAEVVNGTGKTSARYSFTVQSVAVTPTISSVSPASPQATDGRQNLTITGTNFDASAYVNLYDPAGTQFTLSGTRVVGRSGSTQITVDPNFTSTGAGTWKAEVVNGTGKTSARYSFTVQSVAVTPTISSVSPASPQATGAAQDLTITGTNFAASATVNLRDETNGVDYPNRTVKSRNGSTGITITPNFGNAAARWSVAVVNPGPKSSVAFGFNVISSTTTNQSPFSGTAIGLPNTIQAENFDKGGEGIAYHDMDSANLGGQYRTDGVDIEATAGGGYNVAFVKAGEWLEYTVTVPAGGSTYDLQARVASLTAGGKFRVEFGGVNKTGSVAVPSTGNWQAWQLTTPSRVTLAGGQQVMRVYFEANNSTGYVANLDWIKLSAVTAPVGTIDIRGLPETPEANYSDTFTHLGSDYGSSVGGSVGTAVLAPINGRIIYFGRYGSVDPTSGQYPYGDLLVAIEAPVPPGLSLIREDGSTTSVSGGYITVFLGHLSTSRYDASGVLDTSAPPIALVAGKTGGTDGTRVTAGVTRIGYIAPTSRNGGYAPHVHAGILPFSQDGAQSSLVFKRLDGTGGTHFPGRWPKTDGNLASVRSKLISPVTMNWNLNVPPETQSPYKGTPFAIPTTIQAEDFDKGGEGVAFHDTDATNIPGAYRSDAVDIESTSSGYSVGYAKAGEWLEYTVNVPASGGTYDLQAQVASMAAGGKFRVEFGGVNKTPGSIVVPNTGGWQIYKLTPAVRVTLAGGQQVMRVYFETNNSTGYVANLDWLKLAPALSFSTTYADTNSALTAQLVEAQKYENFIREAAATYSLPPALIAGLGSRESGWGLNLSPKGPTGTGDFTPRSFPTNLRAGALPPDGKGFGRGLMQIDWDAWSFARTGNWTDARANIMEGARILKSWIDFIAGRHPSLTGLSLLRAGTASYNAGGGNVSPLISGTDVSRVDERTTGGNFSADVFSRAGWFQNHGLN